MPTVETTGATTGATLDATVSGRVVSDGRGRRRERNRSLVVDAATELLVEGQMWLSGPLLAVRSRLSVRSVFRYFGTVDAVIDAAVIEFYQHRADLFAFPPPPPSGRRVDAFVAHRLGLYEAAGAMIAAASRTMVRSPAIEAVVTREQDRVGHVIGEWFALELNAMAGERRAVAVGAAYIATMFESWQALVQVHHLDHDQIADVMGLGLRAALTTP